MRSLRQIALLAGGETFGRGLAWLTVFCLPWILAPREYGMVALLATFEGIATGVLLLGQDSGVFWRCAREPDPDRPRDAVRAAMLITACASLLGLAVVASIAGVTGGRLLGVPAWPHLWLLGVGVILGNTNRVALAFARATGRTRAFLADRIAVGVARFTSTIGVAVATGSALSFPIGMAAGTAAGGLWLIRRFAAGGRALKAVRSEFAGLLRFGAPLSVHLLAMNTINLVDRWIIGALLGLAAVGSYNWFYMLGSAVVFAYAALSISYEPQIYQEFGRDRTTGSLREFLGVALATAGVYGLAGCAAVLVAVGLVPDSVRADPAIAAIVLIAHWFRPIYLGASYMLSAVGATVRVAGISAVAVVVTVIANLALIPRVGVVGGAWATLIGAIVLVASAVVVLRRASLPTDAIIVPALVVTGASALPLLFMDTRSLAVASVILTLYGISTSGIRDRLRGSSRASAPA